jgi:cytosine/adenosine deaminase-related metal-dependent hydrolase
MTDLLLRGGRVVDPGTGTDAVRDLHLRDGRVAAIGPALPVPEGATVLDVTGCVVGPGFVDLHSHVHTVAGQRLQAYDGVTTALDLESGLMPIDRAYREAAEQGRPLHYGFSASWGGARAQVLMGQEQDASIISGLSVLGDPRWQATSTPAQRDLWLELLRGELAAGALGIGVLMGYAPRTDPAEYLAVARLAAEAGVPTYTHVRELVEADPTTPVDGAEELVRAAAETGAAMHHCHVNSTSRRHVDRVLGSISRARDEGSRVTVEAYPYGAGSTGIGAFFLAPERLAAWGLRPSSLVLLPSGERIADEARLREVRETAPGTPCVVEFLDEQDPVDRALLHSSLAYPDAIVASDAMPVFWSDGSIDSREWPLPPGGSTHPRTAGTFARTLRTMMRETGAWTWLEAFRRCSYLPARVLDDAAPAARAKGHLGVGADADVVVLDPDAVTDVATYLDPTQPSAGVRHLLVSGTPVIRDGELVLDAYPGRGLRGEAR